MLMLPWIFKLNNHIFQFYIFFIVLLLKIGPFVFFQIFQEVLLWTII